MDELLNLINTYVENLANTEIINKFQLNDKCINGELKIITSKDTLTFNVEIPHSFPLGGAQSCIKFYSSDTEGYLHVNLDNSICLHSSLSADIKVRLKFEFELLFEWIQKYYIEEQKEEQYQYLLLPSNINEHYHHLFYTDIDKVFNKNDCGYFDFSLMGYDSIIVQCIGNSEIGWSKDIKSFKKDIGFWIFIADEPIVKRRKVALKWSELDRYISKNAIERLCNYLNQKKMKTDEIHVIPLMIGYFIKKDKNEIHWEMIKLPVVDDFPIEINFKNGCKDYQFNDSQIRWQNSTNLSYDRFFGRGKISDKITEKKILIIGTGALGSNLALMLAKGGVRELALCDFDIVESGNLCRANFDLFDIGKHKVTATRDNLIELSPFINVECLFEIQKVMPYSPKFQEVKIKIEKYDLIFDCSTDNEIAYMLDVMKPNCHIINLSITNKANKLICAANSNISEKKNHLIEKEDEHKALLWVGTGCRYPTFEASNLDIQVLLNYALKNIECQFANDEYLTSFIIRNINNAKKFEMQLSYLNEFIEPISGLQLLVSDEILNQVKDISTLYYPRETGGVLVGSYRSDNRTIFIKVIIQPDIIESTSQCFVRNSEYINKKIEELYKETNGEAVYIGEWHSHPDGTTNYSSTDLNAMKEIANNINTRNKTPLMLIQSINPKKNNFEFYLYKENKLLSYNKK